MLKRLVKALDRYAKRPKLPIYLTEFGIQSKPDPIYGVSEQRQAEYRAISEKIAFDNRRVRAFCQYLMRDDKPRSGADRFGGFESGLPQQRRARSRPTGVFETCSPSQTGSRDVLWGLYPNSLVVTGVTVERCGLKRNWTRWEKSSRPPRAASSA